MSSTNLLAAIAAAAAIASTASVASPAQARPGQTEARVKQISPELRVVPNISLSGDAAYRWQYFSDPRALHAVVISPLGEYFLSVGDGLKQITGPTAPVPMTQPTQG